ncbi:MAG: type IV pili methyl-accepting chemotaxis transducer N-terminal domain-containing protein [Burkholderiales bacterium]|nr:type IV pili methyl-accepting chemotaxis transducer N-terminal domain-containing protein [Burkholderiales bacterium]
MKTIRRGGGRACAAGVALLPWLAAAGVAIAAEPDYAALIDMAGRQRMLSQRTVKAYCQVGQSVTTDVSRRQLTGAVARFDRQLAELRRRVPGGEAEKAVARLGSLWAPFRRIALGPPAVEGARRLAERDDAIAAAADALVAILQEAAGTSQARLVNLAGRQRMLSQRLAKLYMLRSWGIDSEAMALAADSAADEFTGALEILRAAPENTPAIEHELAAVALQWEWFRTALALAGARSYRLVVADASESILNSLELVTELYATLGRR